MNLIHAKRLVLLSSFALISGCEAWSDGVYYLSAISPSDICPGEHYYDIPAVPELANGISFFYWYGSTRSWMVEDALQSVSGRLDSRFIPYQRYPSVANGSWEESARWAIGLELLGKDQNTEIINAFYDYHGGSSMNVSSGYVERKLVSNGVSRTMFESILYGDEQNRMMDEYEMLLEKVPAVSIPVIVVNGSYMVNVDIFDDPRDAWTASAYLYELPENLSDNCSI